MSKIYKTAEEKMVAFSNATLKDSIWSLEVNNTSDHQGDWFGLSINDPIHNIINKNHLELRIIENPEIKAVDLLGWYVLDFEGDCSQITGYRKDGRIETGSQYLELGSDIKFSKDGKTNWLKLEDIFLCS